MSVFSRLTDIVNSNINSLLDKAEDPEKMVRLIIQEMEETLVEVRTTSARAIADKKELARRGEWFRQEADEWDRKAEVAVRKGRDDLARAALMERNRALENAAAVQNELSVLEATLAKLADDTMALQQKLKDAKSRQNSIVIRGKAATTRLSVRRQLHESNIDDAIERFEQYERKMDDIEGQIEAYDLGKRNLSEEIEELEHDEHIDAELDKLKARLSAKGPEDNRPEDNPGTQS